MTPEQREAKAAYGAAYYHDHKEEAAAYGAAYYQDHREEKAAYQATYNAAHRDEKAAYDADRYQCHKEEARAHGAAWYQGHRGAILEKIAKEQAEFTEWLQILRANNGCEDCEVHEGRLLHHHVDPGTKMFKVSEMYSRSLDTLEDELEKCVVQCHPCHMARHVEMKAA